MVKTEKIIGSASLATSFLSFMLGYASKPHGTMLPAWAWYAASAIFLAGALTAFDWARLRRRIWTSKTGSWQDVEPLDASVALCDGMIQVSCAAICGVDTVVAADVQVCDKTIDYDWREFIIVSVALDGGMLVGEKKIDSKQVFEWDLSNIDCALVGAKVKKGWFRSHWVRVPGGQYARRFNT